MLEVRRLTKRYGKSTVVDDCSLTFRTGEVHGLLGANGAGKSTLVRMIAGLVSPSSGSMSFRGNRYSPATKRDAEQAGIE
ncbi:MAG: ATP-binding cassette domain-containing protein, partial [Planctomycetales bacterium]|nr:ATP-binding cassette domain-containing protein [Planctomycetales bacterium]